MYLNNAVDHFFKSSTLKEMFANLALHIDWKKEDSCLAPHSK